METPDGNTSKELGFCHFSEDYKHIPLSVAYSVTFVLALPLNITVLWLCWHQTKRWGCSTIYVANLMVADLLYVLTLPFLVVTYCLGDRWLFGGLLCRLVRFLFHTSLYSAILLLGAISVHRCLGVCLPLHSLPCRTPQHALRATATTWALVLLQLLPTLAFSHTGYRDGQVVCYDTTDPTNFDRYFAYGMVLMLSGFALPSMVIVACYSLMVWRLINPEDILEGTGRAARAKSIRTILLVCSLFLLGFLPYHAARGCLLVSCFLPSRDCRLQRVANMAYHTCRPLVSVSTCLHPVLYFLPGGGRLRRLRELWHKVGAPPVATERGHRDRRIWALPDEGRGARVRQWSEAGAQDTQT